MLRELLQGYQPGNLATVAYPEKQEAIPSTLRGRPALVGERCDGDGACARACPTEAIQVEPWSIDLGKCLFCGACAEVCPSQAITFTHDYELSTRRRADLIVDGNGQPKGAGLPKTVSRSFTTQRTLPLLNAMGPHGDLETMGQRLKERLARLFRRSLHIRHLDSGSCNGCDWELTTLLNPVHDLQRFGFDFVASPRHADLLLTTGTMTRNLTIAALRTYRAMPEPRLVVAVGACGCSGGIFSTTYAGGGGTNTVLPVDIFIPGCPPRPQALLYGLLLAVDRVEQKRGGKTTEREPGSKGKRS